MISPRGLPVEIHTSRCLLRVLEESDVTEKYVSWLNNPDINRYLEARFATHSIESVRNTVRGYWHSNTDVLFGIFFKQDVTLHIGNIKISGLDRNNGVAEIGFMIGDSDYWSRGIATEVITSLCDWMFLELGLKKITAGAYANNIGSEKALIKAGFFLEATLQSHAVLQGNSRTDVHRFAKFSSGHQPS